jgi:Rrf2 family protein
LRTISRKTKYGLRALYALTRRYQQGPVLIPTLAREEKIPLKFLEAILLQLKRAGLLESKKGKRGGYRLVQPPAKITLGYVIRTMEGPLAPLPCASETAFRPCEECEDISQCGTRLVMRQVRDATAGILDRTTLADVVREIDRARAQKDAGEALMYYI